MEDTRKEFKELVLELIKVPDEAREAEVISRLDEISPYPEYSDYIFHSDEFYIGENEFDIEGLTEKVFNYQPIKL